MNECVLLPQKSFGTADLGGRGRQAARILIRPGRREGGDNDGERLHPSIHSEEGKLSFFLWPEKNVL